MSEIYKRLRPKIFQILCNLVVWIGLSISYPADQTSRIINNAYYQLAIVVILFLFNLAFLYVKDEHLDTLTSWIINIFSVVYSVFLVFGRSYIARRNLQLVWGTRTDLVFSFLSWLSMSVLLIYAIRSLVKRFKNANSQSKVILKSEFKKYWLFTFLILAVLWLPYFILSYPGLLDYDGMDQMNELFHAKAIDGVFTLTNHHPIFPTLIEGFCLKIGLSLFKSVNAGVLINNLVLHLLTLAALTSLIVSIEVLFSKKYGYLATAFFGLFPVFPLWSNAVDKTGYFTAFFAFFITSLLWLAVGKKQKHKYIVGLILSGLCLGLTRNDGIVYILMTLIGCLTLKQRKKLVISLLVSALLVVCGSSALVSVTHALPTEPMESIAIPIQQVYRAAIYNPASLTKQNKKSLNKFFHYKSMKKNYDPEFADVSKLNSRWPYRQFKGSYKQKLKKYNKQTFVADKSQFWKTWYDIGKRNRKLYLEAMVAQNIYYVYPQTTPSHYGWSVVPNFGNVQNTHLFSGYSMQNKKAVLAFSRKIRPLDQISGLPIINLLFITFGWFALYASISLVILAQHRYRYLNLILLGLAIVIIGLLSPLNGFSRYYQPLMVLVPVLLIIMRCEYKRR